MADNPVPQSRMRFSLFIVLVAVLLAGIAVGVLVDREVLGPATASGAPVTTPGAGPDLTLVEDAYGIIQQHYVDRPAIQPTALTYGAVAGMVGALGDTGHTRFLSPADLRQEQQSTAGQFEGIGAYVDMQNGNVVIVSPIDGSPAQKAGLQPGDVILQVNGKSTEGQTLDQVVNQVLGPAGSKVTLSILTPATNVTRDVTITRAKIVLHNVTWQQLPGTTIAHLRIAEFSQGVGADLDQALQQIKQQKITGVIFDLRNDPGGLLDESIHTASDFLADGNVLLEKDAQGHTTPVPVVKEPVTTTLPMVVLVNQGTASASEIVAGALQDHKRGQLVGQTTFGTGTVLNEFPLPDGSALLLATQEWLTPNGRVIWHQGITPDVSVDLPPNVQPLIPESERNLTAAQLQSSQDAQLLRAVNILSTSPK